MWPRLPPHQVGSHQGSLRVQGSGWQSERMPAIENGSGSATAHPWPWVTKAGSYTDWTGVSMFKPLTLNLILLRCLRCNPCPSSLFPLAGVGLSSGRPLWLGIRDFRVRLLMGQDLALAHGGGASQCLLPVRREALGRELVNSCGWQVSAVLFLLLCWKECRLVQSLWETDWHYCQKFSIHIPDGPAHFTPRCVLKRV